MRFDFDDRRLDARGFDNLLQFPQIDIRQADRPMEPRLLDDPVIVAIARRLGKTPAQVALPWAVQRGTALLTTSVTPGRIPENFELSTLPEDALQEIRDRVATKVRFNRMV